MSISELKRDAGAIKRAFKIMPDGICKDVLFMRNIVGMSWERIGKTVRYTAEAARLVYARALNQAARLLEEKEASGGAAA